MRLEYLNPYYHPENVYPVIPVTEVVSEEREVEDKLEESYVVVYTDNKQDKT